MPRLKRASRNWWKILSTLFLFSTGVVIVPISIWWYLPSVLWWFYRSILQSVSSIWILLVAVLLSMQMSVLWSLPVGVVLVLVSLSFWSLESILNVRNTAIRWSLEILHGFAITALVLALGQSLTLERLLLNCLVVLAFMTAVIVSGQQREK